MRHYIIMAAAVLALVACNRGGQFKVQGVVDGAGDSTTLVLEQSSNGEWQIIDSIRLGNDGKFSVSAEAPEVPSIYQLRLGGQTICFPIDSIDHLTIKANANHFGSGYSIEGSDHAVQVMEIDRQAMRYANDEGSATQFQAWKDSLARQVASDPGGIVAYYAINKYINGTPLFDPMNDKDLRIIGAVANAFNTFHPDDPRTAYLVQQLLNGQRQRRAAAAPSDTVYADVASIINIKLQDYNGKEHDLSQVAAQHRIVLLDFTVYDTEIAPRMNKLLNDIYKRHSGSGLAIYQVGLDPDNVAWRQAAQNLPWITVMTRWVSTRRQWDPIM